MIFHGMLKRWRQMKDKIIVWSNFGGFLLMTSLRLKGTLHKAFETSNEKQNLTIRYLRLRT